MLESEFKKFLCDDPNIRSEKAVSTRLSRGRAIEAKFGEKLDFIVATDNHMFAMLKLINETMPNSNGVYSNALRKYYEFKNDGRKFPKIKDYDPSL